jgi:hypothetical protein
MDTFPLSFVSSTLSSRASGSVVRILFGFALLAACYSLNISAAAAQSFASKVDYPTGANSFPNSVAIADLNNDGKADLAVAVEFFDAVDVFINNGDGTFASGVYYTVNGDTAAVTVGDFNADGKPDLASAGHTGSNNGSVCVLINNGDGTFATAVVYSTGPSSNTGAIAAGDFNGDGKSDLAATDSPNNVVSVFINNGNGTFAAEVEYPSGSGPSSVAVADFNGDSKPDLAITNLSGDTISVLINNGNGTFAAKVDYPTGVGSNPLSIAAGDFNGDGKPDLATANNSNSMMSVLINNRSGTFASKVDYATGTLPYSVVIGDFTGDGKPDLAVANYSSNRASVFRNNGNGTFAAKVDFTTGANSNPTAIGAGDVNADGKPDMATANNNNGSVSVFINSTPSATCLAPMHGLIAWYPGEDPASSNLSCGGTGCVPEIKGANSGTARANTAYGPGRVGQAFQFSTNNGSSLSQVNVADSASLRSINALTIETWINPTAPGAADNPIIVKGDLSSGGSQPYSILFVNVAAGDNRIIFRVGNTSTFDSLVGNGNIPLNTYTHIAVTYDGTTMKLFINGTLDSSKTTAIGNLNQNSLALHIGGGASDFAGAIDELKIYNHALLQTEIQSIVTADTAGVCRTGSTFPALPKYDAAADFSVWSNASKLNGGVWSYGSAASLAAAFAPYANVQTSVGGGTFGNGYIDAWDAVNNSGPGVFHNASAANQVYSGTVIQTPFELVLQPGSYSFVRWTAPTTGQYNLDSFFSARDVSPTTTDVYVIKNYGTAAATTYFSGFIQSNSQSQSFSINFPTNAGDTIDFVVGPGTAQSPGGTSPANDSTGLNATITKLSNLPTAAPSTISGRIVDSAGNPVEGAVVQLGGTQNRKFITDADGYYRFENAETNGFYTVTPSRANYTFSPTARSFSQIGASTDATFGATLLSSVFVNPLDTPEYFVRQQYLDFLGREPDGAGFNFWSEQILGCGEDSVCVERRRENVSAAYFLSIEFQQTGGLVDRLYRASYGRQSRYSEFMPDTHTVGAGVAVGVEGWQTRLQANKEAFVAAFINRPSFVAVYGNMDNNSFIDTLISHTGVTFTTAERDALVSGLSAGVVTRADVLRSIAENNRFATAKSNEAFVMMEYFGYLRRDTDESGYQFWLNKLNEFNGNFERAEMVKAFIVSGEYRDRFPR